MKRNLFVVLLFALLPLVNSNAQKVSGVLNVTARISGLNDGTQVELYPGATHNDEKKIAEAVVKNGEIRLSVPAEGPRMYYFLVSDTYGILEFMADKGDNVTITATATLTPSQRDKSFYTFSAVQVDGSKTQQEFNQKYSARKRVEAMYSTTIDKYSDIPARLSKAREAKDSLAIKEIMASSEFAALSVAEHKFYLDMEHVCDSTITANKDTWWGPFLMLKMMTYFTPEQLNTYKQLSPAAQKSHYGKLVYEELSPAVEVGQKMPMFYLTQNDGKKINGLSSLSGKKYVLVDFWASWCVPCRKEIPNLKKIYELYHAKGFDIVSISIDKDAQAWQKALKEENLPWNNYRDVDQSVSTQFKVRSIPQLYLMDASGKLIADNLRGEALAAKLAELFK